MSCVSSHEAPEPAPLRGAPAPLRAGKLRPNPQRSADAQDGRSGLCPPPGPAHHYAFTLYALDTLVSLPPHKTKADLRKAIYGRIVVRVELIGRYKRKGGPHGASPLGSSSRRVR